MIIELWEWFSCVAYKTFFTTLRSPLSYIDSHFIFVKLKYSITCFFSFLQTLKVSKVAACLSVIHAQILTSSWCSFHMFYAPLVWKFLSPLGLFSCRFIVSLLTQHLYFVLAYLYWGLSIHSFFFFFIRPCKFFLSDHLAHWLWPLYS